MPLGLYKGSFIIRHMQRNFEYQSDSYLATLMDYRARYLAARARFSAKKMGQPNIPELAVLLARGGMRLPQWLKSVNVELENLRQPLQHFDERDLHHHFDRVRRQLLINRVVPKTKIDLLTSYLCGQTCATALSLCSFAGIAKSTAHKWLGRCAVIGLVEIFQTVHEVFYLQPQLIQLVLIGTSDSQSLFRTDFNRDLSQLRARRDAWLQTSKLAHRNPLDMRSITY